MDRVAVSWGLRGVTVCAQMLERVCPDPEAWSLGTGPLHSAGDLVMSGPALPDQCGKCIRRSGLPRLLGNVMRLPKWGPGPEGGGAPTPGSVGYGHSFPESRSGSADERRTDGVGVGKPDPAGLERGLPPGAAWGEGVRRGEQANPGWAQEPLMPARTDRVEPSMLLREKPRPRDAGGPTAKSTRDTR